MAENIVVTGTITDGRTIRLDETLASPTGRVRLTVEPVESPQPRASLLEFLGLLSKRQAERGHVGRSREEIDAALREERDSWDD